MSVPVLSLVYVSSASVEFSRTDLIQLLRQSREKNGRLGITGMLLYKDGNFIQILEGPEKEVRDLYQTISADPRHHGVIQLMEYEGERSFPEWSMGFQDLNDPDVHRLAGYTEFMNEPLDSGRMQANPGNAVRLLQIFRHNMR